MKKKTFTPRLKNSRKNKKAMPYRQKAGMGELFGELRSMLQGTSMQRNEDDFIALVERAWFVDLDEYFSVWKPYLMGHGAVLERMVFRLPDIRLIHDYGERIPHMRFEVCYWRRAMLPDALADALGSVHFERVTRFEVSCAAFTHEMLGMLTGAEHARFIDHLDLSRNNLGLRAVKAAVRHAQNGMDPSEIVVVEDRL